MGLKNYGVLKGKAIASRLGAGNSPHYQVHVVDDDTDYRIAINVKSKLAPSELLFLVDDDFRHPQLDALEGLAVGFNELEREPGTAVDYIRGNLFDRLRMRPLPHSIPGPDNDLNEKLDAYVQRAIADEEATVYAFGERWGPETKKDKYFGFRPGNGIHDIHMNQGSAGRFKQYNGVWQDGALLLHFPRIVAEDGREAWPEQWVAVFLAFQSQCWHTDDASGDCVEVAPPSDDIPAAEGDGRLRIVAALVNPMGGDVGKERVVLLNTMPESVTLGGWGIVDKNKRRSDLPATSLEAGGTLVVKFTGEGAQLSNKGGIVTLLDAAGLKVHGVSYTRADARRQGWTLVF